MRHLVLLTFAALSMSPLALGETITKFQATLMNTGVFTLDGESPPELGYAGTANFTLTEPMDGSSPTLEYTIRLSGFESVFGAGDATPDLDKIHIHTARAADGTTIDASFPTPHVLNILGTPASPPTETGHTRGGDDADQTVQVRSNGMVVVSGIWDDSDAFVHTPAGASSRALTGSLDDLFAEQLHLMIHSQNAQAFGNPGGPVIGGQLITVPEPSTIILLGAGLLLVVAQARRRSRRSAIA
ncbi:PEP-CTERM sorting domain-containing protein [Aeoliella sp. ICT_H6.2]|uniref:PEP-CTERM sorting domain-containing protein n=1 Tax=Aeoliella straminimaris TaxID=2954799 RepID=A0A9X2FG47_9BACT|nr:PEP-CTERM sorting domain-containing protein [Aeoliella straminimaris]MCO6047678.1 PEP-CTERM sorting domain-containing protein [Aeoliella straminimaris]